MIFFVLIFWIAQLSAYEAIEHFVSDITVHADASMTVRETITVRSEQKSVRHGIVREFPTTYRDRWGAVQTVGFSMQEALLAGKTVPYHVEKAVNGVKIYLGDKHVTLAPGVHTFTIEYHTARQLGFFKTHDELYWNVTGNGWRLPLERVTARVTLPDTIPADNISWEAYTGRLGSRGKEYRAYRDHKTIVFESTRSFAPGEGLTLVTVFPKGYISEPTWWQQLIWFAQDNLHIIVLLLGLVLLLGYLGFFIVRVHTSKPKDPIIPLFYPPAGMTPGAVAYVMHMGYHDTVLAADLVAMAVQGWLTIEYKEGVWGSGSYILHKKERKSDVAYADLFDVLFSDNDTVTINRQSHARVQQVIARDTARYDYLRENFEDQSSIIVTAIIMACAFWGLGCALIYEQADSLVVGFFVIYIIVIGGAAFLLKTYTLDGWKMQREIEGFKLFLATTESERIKIIGTPPTKNPELFETYLPYAIALGVEQAWSDQFAPLFKQREQEGQPYMPFWYLGRPGLFRSSAFSSGLRQSVSSAISSSGTAPGRSSGSGGHGSSGGGGGGGGGGGW